MPFLACDRLCLRPFNECSILRKRPLDILSDIQHCRNTFAEYRMPPHINYRKEGRFTCRELRESEDA